MINNTTTKNEYTTTGNLQTVYPITFEGATDNSGTPMLRVVLTSGTTTKTLVYNADYSLVLGEVVPDLDESLNLPVVEGIKLMNQGDATAGNHLEIDRSTPLIQGIDFQLGRIDPEQIERGFDLSVLRDQELKTNVTDLKDYVDTQDTTLQTNINNLRSYVDTQDAAIRAIAQSAENKSDAAVETAGEAHSIAEEAINTANDADQKSDDAVDYARHAMDVVTGISGEKFVFTITSGQTTLHFDDDIEDRIIDLYWQGQYITESGNWTVSDDTITMLFGPETGDTVVVILNQIRQVVNQGDLDAHNTDPLAHANLFNNIDCGVM